MSLFLDNPEFAAFYSILSIDTMFSYGIGPLQGVVYFDVDDDL
jgi:hypothetical protein